MSVVAVRGFDPLRDKTYQSTRLGRDIVAFLAWCELGGMSPRTLDGYERDLAKGALLFPDRDAATLTDDDALHIANNYPKGSVRVRCAPWNTFYRWARQTRRATVNPFESLPTFARPNNKVYDTFTDAEIETLVGGTDGALMAILFDAGPRKGDCRHLQLKHLREDGDGHALAFLGGKGGKDRLVPATNRIVRMVTELALVDALEFNDHLWYSVQAGPTHRHVRRRKPIGEASFHTWWVARLEDAGVRYRNPHMARHTFATRWLRNGGRLTTLSMILGHASIKTTFDEYGHLDTRDVLADLAVIEGRA